MGDPTAMLGTYDTSEIGGSDTRHADIRNVTGAFAAARATDLTWAERAIDPDDEEVSPNVVTTSPGLTVNRGDPDEDKRRVQASAARAREAASALGWRPVIPGATGPATRHWMSTASSLGPAVSVEEETDRSAG